MALIETAARPTEAQPGIGSMIEIRNVRKRFKVGDGEVEVLRDVSLTVDAGEFISIIGPSGSGKSTLLNMFTGIDRPSEGSVTVAGSRIDLMSEGQLAKWRGENLGLVFQFFQMLPSLTLLDNVVLPMDFAGKYTRKERRERAAFLLESVGLADQMHKLPGMVSGGQQQRAAIARALSNDPPIVVGDEPTGNLDSASTEMIFRLFLDLVEREGKTLVMVTHNPEIAYKTPRIVEISDGRITRDEVVQKLRM
jgi:putative ABC transport system ATP-binding protein